MGSAMSQSASIEARALERVLYEMRTNSLKMPSLPDVALRVRAIAGDADVSVEALAREISHDAALAARIMRVANSPLIRARNEIRSLPQALLRLGLDYVRDLVTVFAIEGAFEPSNPLIKKMLKEIWTRSKETAAVSSALARLSRGVPHDQALLAGLVHTIGSLPLLAALDDQPSLSIEPQLLMTMIDEIHGDLGVSILQAWRFPEEIARVPEQYRDPYRVRLGPADLSDVVAVAHLLLRSPDNTAQQIPQMMEMDSVKRLGLNSVSELLEGLLASDEVKAGMMMLS